MPNFQGTKGKMDQNMELAVIKRGDEVVNNRVVTNENQVEGLGQLIDSSTCTEKQVTTRVELGEIPLAKPLVNNQISRSPARWKQLSGKENQDKNKCKKYQEYARKRRINNTSKTDVSKKARDSMEVDVEVKLSELAEVGQSQPRQTL